MRDVIHLACGQCSRKTHTTTKNRRLHPDRVEQKQYCRFCKKHTPHKESR